MDNSWPRLARDSIPQRLSSEGFQVGVETLHDDSLFQAGLIDLLQDGLDEFKCGPCSLETLVDMLEALFCLAKLAVGMDEQTFRICQFRKHCDLGGYGKRYRISSVRGVSK